MRINDNHLGRTTTGRYTWQPAIILEPDDYPVDSKFWHNLAKAAANELVERIGLEAYHNWCDANVPDAPPPFDWRATYDKIMLKIERLEEEDTCRCDPHPNRESMACAACRKDAAGREIPF